MKRKLPALTLALVLLLCFTGCCSHEWYAATCAAPKTCSLCGETEGEALSHTWVDATCDAPKTCSECGATEGEALGHTWVDATCETAKTCSVCNYIDGEAPGHTWVDATTETPKTCSVCAVTEGERIITDERFTTASTIHLHGSWEGQFALPAEDFGFEDMATDAQIRILVTFGNDGTLSVTNSFANLEEFTTALEVPMKELALSTFAQSGYSQEQAEQLLKDSYDMTLDEYVAYLIKSMNLEASLTEETKEEMVYYVSDGKVYYAASWSDLLEFTEYTLEGDTLTLGGYFSDMEDNPLAFTRVAE